MTFKRAFFLWFLLEVMLLFFPMLIYGFSIDAIHVTTRFSGRLSLLIFSLLFILPPEKRELSLSSRSYHIFAIAHGIHLIELLSFVYLNHTVLNPIRLTGGFLAYVFVFIMPYLATRAAKSKISVTSFKRIQYGYDFYIWLIFFLTYLPRILGKLPLAGGTFSEHVTLFVWVCIMPLLKLISLLKFKTIR